MHSIVEISRSLNFFLAKLELETFYIQTSYLYNEASQIAFQLKSLNWLLSESENLM